MREDTKNRRDNLAKIYFVGRMIMVFNTLKHLLKGAKLKSVGLVVVCSLVKGKYKLIMV